MFERGEKSGSRRFPGGRLTGMRWRTKSGGPSGGERKGASASGGLLDFLSKQAGSGWTDGAVLQAGLLLRNLGTPDQIHPSELRSKTNLFLSLTPQPQSVTEESGHCVKKGVECLQLLYICLLQEILSDGNACRIHRRDEGGLHMRCK